MRIICFLAKNSRPHGWIKVRIRLEGRTGSAEWVSTSSAVFSAECCQLCLERLKPGNVPM